MAEILQRQRDSLDELLYESEEESDLHRLTHLAIVSVIEAAKSQTADEPTEIRQYALQSIDAAAMASQEQARFPNLGLDEQVDDWSVPLWKADIPWKTQECWEGIQREFKTAGAAWRRNLRWYEGILLGNPVSEEFQVEAALESAEEQNLVRGKTFKREQELIFQEMEQRLDSLQASLQVDEETRHSIGGNNPPSDYRLEEEQAKTILWENLLDIRKEIGTASPDVKRLEEVSGFLRGLVSASYRWLAGQTRDALVDTAKYVRQETTKIVLIALLGVAAAHLDKLKPILTLLDHLTAMLR